MRAFSVEIFNQKIEYQTGGFAETFVFVDDYMDPAVNKIVVIGIDKARVKNRDYIRVLGDNVEYVGVVTQVESSGHNMLTISFKGFNSILDVSFYVDWVTYHGVMGDSTVIIQRFINNLFINNKDDKTQNIPCLSISVELSDVFNFLYLENIVGTTINLLDFVIEQFKNYGTTIKWAVKPESKRLYCVVRGMNGRDRFVIESNLPNIIDRNITIREVDSEINKAIIVNSDQAYFEDEKIVFYKHPNGTVDRNNTDRIIPVKFKTGTVKAKSPSVLKKEFDYAQMVYESAKTIKSTDDEDVASYTDMVTAITRQVGLIEKEKGKTSEEYKDANAYLTAWKTMLTTAKKRQSKSISEEKSAENEYEKAKAAYEGYAADFLKKATEKVKSIMPSVPAENLIEIECNVQDELIRPAERYVGQPARIIVGTDIYETMLTKIAIGDTALLTFGTVRLELTKKIKAKWRAENYEY